MNVEKFNQKPLKVGWIKAVLFDLFDTLLLIRSDDNFAESCLRNIHRFLNMNGINVSFEDFRHTYSKVRKHLYERIHRKLEEPHFTVRISRVLRELGYECDASSPIAKGAADAYCEAFTRYVHPDEDAYFVLRRLRKSGYKIGIVSNFAIPECAHHLITLYGLKNLLDAVVVSAEVNRRKPSPEIFVAALNLLKVDASESIFVGDTPDIDILGAKNIGMKAILIERRKTSFKADVKPDFMIKRLREILGLLKISSP